MILLKQALNPNNLEVKKDSLVIDQKFASLHREASERARRREESVQRRLLEKLEQAWEHMPGVAQKRQFEFSYQTTDGRN